MSHFTPLPVQNSKDGWHGEEESPQRQKSFVWGSVPQGSSGDGLRLSGLSAGAGTAGFLVLRLCLSWQLG